MDILNPIPSTSPQSTIFACKEFLRQLRTETLILKENNRYIGIISQREIYDAVDKNLGDQPVALIAQSIDRISPAASDQEIRQRLAQSTNNALLVCDEEYVLGYINYNAALGRLSILQTTRQNHKHGKNFSGAAVFYSVLLFFITPRAPKS